MAPSHSIGRVSAQALAQRLQRDDRPILVHTLPNDHFKQTHILGAQNACVFDLISVQLKLVTR